eukprot:3134747-Amphidinium_carterae.1
MLQSEQIDADNFLCVSSFADSCVSVFVFLQCVVTAQLCLVFSLGGGWIRSGTVSIGPIQVGNKFNYDEGRELSENCCLAFKNVMVEKQWAQKHMTNLISK